MKKLKTIKRESSWPGSYEARSTDWVAEIKLFFSDEDGSGGPDTAQTIIQDLGQDRDFANVIDELISAYGGRFYGFTIEEIENAETGDEIPVNYTFDGFFDP